MLSIHVDVSNVLIISRIDKSPTQFLRFVDVQSGQQGLSWCWKKSVYFISWYSEWLPISEIEPGLTSSSSLVLLVFEFVFLLFLLYVYAAVGFDCVRFFIHNAMQAVIILLVIVFDYLSGCMRIILLVNPHQSVTRIGGVMVSVLASSVVVWILRPVQAKQKLWNW